MTLTLRQIAEQEDPLASGHGLCAGCSESTVVRQVLHALDRPVVVAMATGCLEVSTTRFPNTAWKVPAIHSAFENVASTIAGVETAYRALVKRGRIPAQEGMTFVAFGGDGATYDIGLQWLSGALERGHRFLYICLNNEAYMNTGIQRSGATIAGTWTTTTPVGSVIPGKVEWRKNLTGIIAAHNIPFVAQAAVHNWKDLMTKVRQAASLDGPGFINVMAPCTRGWRYAPEDTIRISKLAVDTCVWPLFEINQGVWKLNERPRHRKPVREWLASQGRFSHLLKPENSDLVRAIEERVEAEWQELLARCGVAEASA